MADSNVDVGMEAFKGRCILKWLEIFETIFPKEMTPTQIAHINPRVLVLQMMIKYISQSMCELEYENEILKKGLNCPGNYIDVFENDEWGGIESYETENDILKATPPTTPCPHLRFKDTSKRKLLDQMEYKVEVDSHPMPASFDQELTFKRMKLSSKTLVTEEQPNSTKSSAVSTTTIMRIKCISDIPELTEENYSTIIRVNPTVRLFELKSVQGSYTEKDCEIYNNKLLKEGLHGNYNPLTPGWLEDGAVNCFINSICSKNKTVEDYIVSLSAALTAYFFMAAEAKDLPDRTPGNLDINWTKAEIALFPLNLQNNHWILIVVWLKKGEYSVLDSAASKRREYPTVVKGIRKLETRLEVKLNEVTIEVDKQKNCWDCGVYICAYASLIAQGKELHAPINPNSFRIHIMDTILGVEEIRNDQDYDNKNKDRNDKNNDSEYKFDDDETCYFSDSEDWMFR